MSPETHAVNLRHDNSSNSKIFKSQSTNLKMLRPARPARAQRSRAAAERSPFHCLQRYFCPAERRRREQRPSREKHAPLLVQQWQPGCLLEEARTRSWAKTHIYGYSGSEAERGKEGGERVWTWLTDAGNGWRTSVKSLFGVLKGRICVGAVLRFRYQQPAFKIKIPARKGTVLLLSGFLSLDQTQFFFNQYIYYMEIAK